MHHLSLPNIQLNRLGYSRKSSAGVVDFADTLVNTYGAAEVWKLTDIVSGTTIPAYVDSARNGVLQGWTLQDAASPVVGDVGLAPFSDGANDYGNLYSSNGSTGLADIFDGQTGSVLVAFRVQDANAWSTSSRRVLRLATAGAVNRIDLLTVGSGSGFRFVYRANSITEQIDVATSSLGWVWAGMTWSLSNNRMRAYWNGTQTGTDQTGLGAWSAALDSSSVTIGALTLTPTGVFPGWLAYVVLWTTEKTPTEMANIYTDAIS